MGRDGKGWRKAMIRLILSGCNGKMGRVFTKTAAAYDDVEIAAGLDVTDGAHNPYPCYTRTEDIPVDVAQSADVLVDFSHVSALAGILTYAAFGNRRIPVVLATTGYDDAQKNAIAEAATKTAIFQTANMSLGINLLVELVQKASGALGDGFDVEIVERHHNQKIDAPSGTALMIADAINDTYQQNHEAGLNYVYDRHSKREKRTRQEIGMHAIRGGTIVGEHAVIFAGTDEVLEIRHSAASKEVFAEGAMRAARFIIGKTPGIYTMKDVLR